MSRFRLRNLLIALIFLSSVSGFSATSSKISPDLAAQTSSGNLPVIIQYKTAPSSLETGLLGLLGGVVTLVLSSINAIVATVPLRQLSSLAADPNVTYISLDRAVTARNAGDITAAEYTAEPINAPVVWEKGYQGTNIGVAVIDSGITPVPDLASNSLTFRSASPFSHSFSRRPTKSAPWSNGRIVYSQNFVPGQTTLSITTDTARMSPDSSPATARNPPVALFPDILRLGSQRQHHQPARARSKRRRHRFQR